MEEERKMDVLVVAHDDSLRDTLDAVFADGGYPTEGVPTAPAALAWLAEHPEPSLVVLASVLGISPPHPEKNGAALLRALHADDAFWQTHAVLCLVDDPHRLGDDILAIMAARAVCVLPRPFDIDELYAAAEDCVTQLIEEVDDY